MSKAWVSSSSSDRSRSDESRSCDEFTNYKKIHLFAESEPNRFSSCAVDICYVKTIALHYFMIVKLKLKITDIC